MDYKFLLQNLFLIIFRPTKAWNTIHSEDRSAKDTRNSFLLPMIILVTLASFFGSLLLTRAQLSVVYSIFTGFKYFIILLFVACTSAFIHKEMTYALDLGRDFSVSFRLIVYSLTPLFICLAVSSLFESLIFVDILALYGLYILWEGSKIMLNPPQHKKMPLLIATAVIVAELYVAASIVMNQVVDRIYFSYFAR